MSRKSGDENSSGVSISVDDKEITTKNGNSSTKLQNSEQNTSKSIHVLQELKKIDAELEPFSSLDYEKWPVEKLVKKLYSIETKLKFRENELQRLESDAKEKLSKIRRQGIQQYDTDATSTTCQNNKRRKKHEGKPFDFSKYKTRFIALRFGYFGWNYSGLALQIHDENTVEQQLLNSMRLLRLIPECEDLNEIKFSRCGRTDKGVSAFNQVIALKVRSKFATEEEIQDPANDDLEINYAEKLNASLPADISIKAVCLHLPEDFDARFSCEYRHYKYLFKLGSSKYHNNVPALNIEAMRTAVTKFIGSHDFRNFCKIDGSKQITNHYRTILDANILELEDNRKIYKDEKISDTDKLELQQSTAKENEITINESSTDDDYYVFDLKGKGFLWHQVRCMVAILFLIGGGHEKPSVINYLFNEDENGNALVDNKFPNKPIYDIASDIPLILYDCQYPRSLNLNWRELEFMDKKFIDSFSESEVQYEIMSMFAKGSVLNRRAKNLEPGKIYFSVGDARGKAVKKYISLKNRPTADSVETVNAKFREKKQNKKKNGKGKGPENSSGSTAKDLVIEK